MAMDPRGSSPYDVFYQAPMLPLARTALWLLGLAACACAATALWRRRTALVWGAFLGALAVAATGAALSMQAFIHPPWERIYAGQSMAEYELVCVERSIPVCVHPAYEATLVETAGRIGRLVEPLVGVAGAPVRAEQLPSRAASIGSGGTLEILPGPFVVDYAAYDLVHESGADLNRAQTVIAIWLMDRGGESTRATQPFFGPGQPDAQVTAAVERFSVLSPDAQRAWLGAHFQELRAGLIEMDDLP